MDCADFTDFATTHATSAVMLRNWDRTGRTGRMGRFVQAVVCDVLSQHGGGLSPRSSVAATKAVAAAAAQWYRGHSAPYDPLP